MTINTIKNNYTFSGQDVRVYAYRNISDENERFDRMLQSRSTMMGESAQSLYAKGLKDASVSGTAQKGISKDGAASQSYGKVKGLSEVEARMHFADLDRTKNDGARRDSMLSVGSVFFEMGTLDALSYSTFREKNAIRTLGRSHAIGYTRGPRTVAGSLTFNATQDNELLAFFAGVDLKETERTSIPMKYVLLDQVDPFNIIIFFSNEMGGHSVLQLFNVELSSESQRMSVHDLVIQNAVNFYATDVIPMQDVGNTFSNTTEMLHGIAKLDEKKMNKGIHRRLKNKIDASTLGSNAKDLLNRSRGLF